MLMELNSGSECISKIQNLQCSMKKIFRVEYVYNPSPREAGVGKWQDQDNPGLHSEILFQQK
jgi:hypothetical protein